MSGSRITAITGSALVLPGHDIDTDRIMPARFLKAVTFTGLEDHVFEDDRREAAGRGLTHAFDDSRRRQARVLLVGSNFGCGSSREHAPQALYRWGIRAVVGESFAEIFAGNALMIGLPCVSVEKAPLAALRSLADADASLEVTVDVETRQVSAGTSVIPVSVPDAAHHALITGEWDATGLLLADYDQVRAHAAALPYVKGF